jgi:hypothetical protein
MLTLLLLLVSQRRWTLHGPVVLLLLPHSSFGGAELPSKGTTLYVVSLYPCALAASEPAVAIWCRLLT